MMEMNKDMMLLTFYCYATEKMPREKFFFNVEGSVNLVRHAIMRGLSHKNSLVEVLFVNSW